MEGGEHAPLFYGGVLGGTDRYGDNGLRTLPYHLCKTHTHGKEPELPQAQSSWKTGVSHDIACLACGVGLPPT